LITITEHRRILEMLGSKNKGRPKSLSFPYTSCIKCGYCGYAYTATRKVKKIKTTGETKVFVYYHCTQKGKAPCPEKIKITEAKLEEQLKIELDKLQISKPFRDFAVELLKKENQNEVIERQRCLLAHYLSVECPGSFPS
jgi:hypothetical protein